MSEKRRDNKNRILQTGESQRKDGRYVYKYVDNFRKTRFVYAWKLVSTDKTPPGKRNDVSLREKEMRIRKDLYDGIDSFGRSMTVSELYQKHISQNANVRPNTSDARNYLLDKLQKDVLGLCPINKVKLADAKEWVLRCQKNGFSYKSIKNHKRSLSAAFHTAVQNDYIRKNPFDFDIRDVIKDNSDSKTALSKTQQNSLLKFIKNDPVYCKNYDEIVIFLGTGLRVSELCGLTKNDIDFKNRVITVNHQLLKNTKLGYYVAPPKTKSSYRQIYMTNKVFKAFKRIVDNQLNNKFKLSGLTDFLFINKNGKPKTVTSYDALFRRIIQKYEKCQDIKLPESVTPHTLRHTFCTNMANAGMNPKSLQYIMGHSSVSMTLNYYSHTSFDVAKEEMKRVSA